MNQVTAAMHIFIGFCGGVLLADALDSILLFDFIGYVLMAGVVAGIGLITFPMITKTGVRR